MLMWQTADDFHVMYQFYLLQHLHLFYKYEELTPALSELIFRLNKYNCNLKILNSHMPNKEISKEVKREELERFSIQEVFNVLHGINSFLLKAYKT